MGYPDVEKLFSARGGQALREWKLVDRPGYRSRAEKKAAEERLQEINAAIDALLKKEPRR